MKINELKKKIYDDEKIELKEIKKEDVVDINEIKINQKKPSHERMLDFLFTVKNPYVFKVNGRLVKVGFKDNNITADQCLSNALKDLFK